LLEATLESRGYGNAKIETQKIMDLWKKLKSVSFCTTKSLFDVLGQNFPPTDINHAFIISLAARMTENNFKEIICAEGNFHSEKEEAFQKVVKRAAGELNIVLTSELMENVLMLNEFTQIGNSIIINGHIASGKTTTWKVKHMKMTKDYFNLKYNFQLYLKAKNLYNEENGNSEKVELRVIYQDMLTNEEFSGFIGKTNNWRPGLLEKILTNFDKVII